MPTYRMTLTMTVEASDSEAAVDTLVEALADSSITPEIVEVSDDDADL